MQTAAPQPEKNRVAAIYARVSTAEQTNNYSLEAQVKNCRNHAQNNGWRHRIYRDPGYSASNLDRPGLEQLIADAEKRKINIILVHRLDRLSRSILDFAQLYAYLQEYNVDVVSTTEPINTTDEIGRFFMYQLINFAQLERELFKRRSITGKRARAHEGKWHGGTPPYGYTYNTKTGHLEPNPEEPVKLIFQKYEEIRTYYGVKQWLDNEGIKPRKAQSWSVQAIRQILKNTIYHGECHYKDIEWTDEELVVV